MQLVLASTSPYRKELLRRLEIPFETAAPLFNEDLEKDRFQGNSHDLCIELARGKALSLKNKFANSVIIGSDQMLLFEDKILGKSGDFDTALAQLLPMQGETAELITAVCISSPKGQREFLESSKLTFKNLDKTAVSKYLQFDEPYDCAGSFKLESAGLFLFESVETPDYTGIQGLPLMRLQKELLELGFEFPFS